MLLQDHNHNPLLQIMRGIVCSDVVGVDGCSHHLDDKKFEILKLVMLGGARRRAMLGDS